MYQKTILNQYPKHQCIWVKEALNYKGLIPVLPSNVINGRNFKIRMLCKRCFHCRVVFLPFKMKPLIQDFPESITVTLRIHYVSHSVLPKARQTTLKCMNNMYHCNELLWQNFNKNRNLCSKEAHFSWL